MKKVLFTHSFFYKLDKKQWKFKQPYPPLGTISAAALVRENGFDVSLFDTNLRDSPDELADVLERENPDYLVIYDDGFNYLTKMCLTTMREAAFRMIRMAKQRNCTVIVSSSDASDHFEAYLRHGADFVLIGEAEFTLLELLKHLDNERSSPDEIAGLAFESGGKIRRTGARPVLRDLDTLPAPAWDLVDIESYRHVWLKHHRYFSLNIATTRGCPFRCNWCAKPIYGNRYNTRSPEKVIDEIALLLSRYSPDHFWITDDIFGLKPGWIQSFDHILKERNLDIRYKIQSRVDLLLHEDTIDALARSGLETVWVGAESGSQKILDAMDKGTTVEQIRKATELLKRKGVRVAFFLQFGYLGETREDIERTRNMVLELMPDEIGISVSYPLPGTGFYETVKERLGGKANWTDSDDLDSMFADHSDRAFYRKLPGYIHKVYRQKRAVVTVRNWLKNPMSVTYSGIRSVAAALYYWPSVLIDRIRLRKYESFPG